MDSWEWQEGPCRLQKVGPTTCGYCLATFTSTHDLRAHKLEKFEEENLETGTPVHFWCSVCDRDFHTLGGMSIHIRQSHRPKQDILCPGCAVKFDSLSSFIKHVELGQCTMIDLETLQTRFAAKFAFARGLAKLDLASKQELPFIKKKDFSLYLGYDADPEAPWQESPNLLSQWEVPDSNTWAPTGPAPSKDDAFPRMAHQQYLRGNNNDPDFLIGDQSNALEGKYEENDWARDKTLYPNSGPAQRPTAEQLQSIQSSQQAALNRSGGEKTASFDPNSPYFDAQQFWHPILRKYKCPHKATCTTSSKHSTLGERCYTLGLRSVFWQRAPKCMKLAKPGLHRCRKSFNKKAALVQHLRSAKHNGKKFTCPCCMDSFDALYSLAGHVEAPSRKCQINREFDEQVMYRIFLDQLTLGMIECGEIFDDATQKFEFQEDFKALYDPQKTSGQTFGHKQIHGFSDGGTSATTGRSGLTKAALSKHQQQLGDDGSVFTPPGQQRGGGRIVYGPDMALTTDALSKLQLQEERSSPWGQRSGMNRPEKQQQQGPQRPQQTQPQKQQQKPQTPQQPQQPQQQRGSYVWQQLASYGWDTWDQRPRFREEDKDCRVEPKGGGSSDSER